MLLLQTRISQASTHTNTITSSGFKLWISTCLGLIGLIESLELFGLISSHKDNFAVTVSRKYTEWVPKKKAVLRLLVECYCEMQ